MDALSAPRCFCPCHLGASVLAWYPPAVTDPVESLASCDLCWSLHRETWSVYKRPRVTKRWVDPDPPA